MKEGFHFPGETLKNGTRLSSEDCCSATGWLAHSLQSLQLMKYIHVDSSKLCSQLVWLMKTDTYIYQTGTDCFICEYVCEGLFDSFCTLLLQHVCMCVCVCVLAYKGFRFNRNTVACTRFKRCACGHFWNDCLIRFENLDFVIYCVRVDWQLWITVSSLAALPCRRTHTKLDHCCNVLVILMLLDYNTCCPVTQYS